MPSQKFGIFLYAWRIAIILRKSKLLDLELEFLEAFNAKFFDGVGQRYGQIGERIVKLRKLISRRDQTVASASERTEHSSG